MQQQDAFVVTVIKPPVKEMTIADLIVGSLGLAGASLLLALALGAVFGGGLVLWHRLRPRNWRPMPPVAPSITTSDVPPSSRARPAS
ncbi:MAG TPA: hypothetical protein VFV78_09240 [Vicinamibacterales bacterium]|nr:hypothetical protein [Vicinamibacterales bacterium]